MFGTRDNIRWIGGPYGPIITGTVDSSFASHPDLKGQSSWSVQIGGGGASIFDTKKHLLLLTAQHHAKLVVHTCLFQIISMHLIH